MKYTTYPPLTQFYIDQANIKHEEESMRLEYCTVEELKEALSAMEADRDMYRQQRDIAVDALKQFAGNQVGIGWRAKFANETLAKVEEVVVKAEPPSDDNLGIMNIRFVGK